MLPRRIGSYFRFSNSLLKLYQFHGLLLLFLQPGHHQLLRRSLTALLLQLLTVGPQLLQLLTSILLLLPQCLFFALKPLHVCPQLCRNCLLFRK